MIDFLNKLLKVFRTKNNQTGIDYSVNMIEQLESGADLTQKQLDWCMRNSKLHKIRMPDNPHINEHFDDGPVCDTFNVPSLPELNKIVFRVTETAKTNKNLDSLINNFNASLDKTISELGVLQTELIGIKKALNCS